MVPSGIQDAEAMKTTTIDLFHKLETVLGVAVLTGLTLVVGCDPLATDGTSDRDGQGQCVCEAEDDDAEAAEDEADTEGDEDDDETDG